ncbi:unnamed protein product [Caenorhabditis nigoni]
MKLLRFPYLVQDEILHNVGYSELFLLSFLSKNMSKLIKKSQQKRFEDCIGSIEYKSPGTDDYIVSVYRKHCESNSRIIMQFVRRKKNKRNRNFKLSVYGKMYGKMSGFRLSNKHNFLPNFKLNGFEMKIPFRMTRKNGQHFPVAYFRRNEIKSVIKAFQTCFSAVFGNSMHYRWIMSDFPSFAPKIKNLAVLYNINALLMYVMRTTTPPIYNPFRF